MSELTKLKIFVCFELFLLRSFKKISSSDLTSLYFNIRTLLNAYYILDVEDFSTELRRLYYGSDINIYTFVSKFLRYLNKSMLYIS